MLTSYLKTQHYVPWLKKALDRNTGARGLRSILENSLLETMYDLPSRSDVGTVVVNEAVINGEAEPEFKSERQPKKTEEASTEVRFKSCEL